MSDGTTVSRETRTISRLVVQPKDPLYVQLIEKLFEFSGNGRIMTHQVTFFSKLEARNSKLEARISKLEARSSKLEARNSKLEARKQRDFFLNYDGRTTLNISSAI